MKRAWMGLVLLVSVGLNIGFLGIAVARHRGFDGWRGARAGGEMPPADFGARLADRLRLSPESRPRFLALQRKLARATIEGRQEIFRLRHELRSELLAPQPDRAEIDRLLGEVDRRERELNQALVDTLLESRQLLHGRELDDYLRFLERFAPGRGGPPGGPLGGPSGGRRGPPGRR